MPKTRTKDPAYLLTVHLTDDRKSKHYFHTFKSARHYAKDRCNERTVTRIVVSGGAEGTVTLYDREKADA